VVIGLLRDGVGLGLGKPFGTESPWVSLSAGEVVIRHLPIPESVLGIIIGPLVFLAIDLFSRLVFRKEGMGLGDVKLAAAIGAVLGPWLALVSFAGAVALGAAISIGLIVARWRKRDQYIPFGPMMAVAAFVIALWPTATTHWTYRAIEWWLFRTTG
jgi:prepilin signal peptidase PulO-like enzyme (type II secretory pathway)